MDMTTQPPDPDAVSNGKIDFKDPAKWVVNDNLWNYIIKHGISQNDNPQVRFHTFVATSQNLHVSMPMKKNIVFHANFMVVPLY